MSLDTDRAILSKAPRLARHGHPKDRRWTAPPSLIDWSRSSARTGSSTVPPTSSLVMVMFGTRYMAMLYGFAFFSHQVGGFLGVWLGGVLYEAYGSYIVVWWLSVALGIASAVINIPIVERPVERPAALQPAE